MYYLAHISDIHLSPLPEPSVGELIGKRLTGYINWKTHRKDVMNSGVLAHLMRELHLRNPHHTAITGDLVNLALKQEYINAREWLSQQGNPKDISLVFGNHDAYVVGAFKTACRVFAPWISGDVALARAHPFPYMRVRGQLAIIGLSSAIATPPFCASGFFGAGQARQLRALCKLSDELNLFKVLLIHHPPLAGATRFASKLWGIGRLQKTVAACGAHLILHGHTHLPTLSYIPGKQGAVVPVVGVASASQQVGSSKPAANFNWFAIERRDDKWSCVLSRYTIVGDNNRTLCTQTQKLS